VGYSEAQALILVMENNLAVGDVVYIKSDMAAGLVVTQSEKAWYDVPQFTEIDFEISGGPSYSGDGKTVPTDEDMKEPETTPPETEPPVPETEETEQKPEETEKDDSDSGGGLFKDIEDFYEQGGTEDEWFDGFFFDED